MANTLAAVKETTHFVQRLAQYGASGARQTVSSQCSEELVYDRAELLAS